MTTEVKLRPGWLLRDVRVAAERLAPDQAKTGVSNQTERRDWPGATERADATQADHNGRERREPRK